MVNIRQAITYAKGDKYRGSRDNLNEFFLFFSTMVFDHYISLTQNLTYFALTISMFF